MKIQFVLSFLLSFYLLDCLADSDREKSYIFSKIDYQQGLSNSAVISVFQDNTGLMWFGTYDGVNCYDGKEMEVYRADSVTGLTNNVIYRITQGDGHHLWIETDAGLNLFSTDFNKVVKYFDVPEEYCVHSNRKGNTWLVGYGWVAYYNTRLGRFCRVECPNLKIDNLVTKAFVTDDGKLWLFPVSSVGQMNQFSLDSFEGDTLSSTLHPLSTTFHNKPIHYIYYQNDVFCFVDSDNDLYMYDISRKSKIYIRNIAGLIQKYGEIKGVVPFYEDIIIAFWTNGLIRLKTSHRYEEEIIDRNVRVFDVYQDTRQGTLWVGSDGQGVIMYAKKYSIATNLMLNSLSPNLSRQVRSLMTDKYGGLWFGTKGDGLLHVPNYNNNLDVLKASVYFPDFSQSAVLYEKGSKEFQVYSLRQSHYMDGFWVGTGDNGLFYYSFVDNRLHQVADTLGHDNKNIHSILEENDSTLYLATAGEGIKKIILNREDDRISIKREKSYHFFHEGQPITMFFSMVAEGDSVLWFGSRGKGVIRFNRYTENYQVISLKALLNKSVDDVLCMYRFPDGRLYVGTTSGLVGLNFQNGGVSAEYLGREQGLLNDMVHGILKDANDFLWLGTNKGLVKYNPTNQSFHTYYYTCGVQIGEFSDDAYYKCPYTGNLFFGGNDGLLYMGQEMAIASEFYPDILLRSLYVNGAKVHLTDYLSADGKAILLDSKHVSLGIKNFLLQYNSIPYLLRQILQHHPAIVRRAESRVLQSQAVSLPDSLQLKPLRRLPPLQPAPVRYRVHKIPLRRNNRIHGRHRDIHRVPMLQRPHRLLNHPVVNQRAHRVMENQIDPPPPCIRLNRSQARKITLAPPLQQLLHLPPTVLQHNLLHRRHIRRIHHHRNLVNQPVPLEHVNRMLNHSLACHLKKLLGMAAVQTTANASRQNYSYIHYL